MHEDARRPNSIPLILKYPRRLTSDRRTPHMHFVSGFGQPRSDKLRVIADAPRLRRILARDEMIDSGIQKFINNTRAEAARYFWSR
jgi:hypothetical protein